MKITRISPFTGKTHTFELNVTSEQIFRWQGGELIQNVFSHLTPDEREFLKTGITPDEWNDAFGTMDDEGDPY